MSNVFQTGASTGISRGCGTREECGVYAESGLSVYGDPLEAFLFDPPLPFKAPSALGVHLVDRPTPITDADGTVRTETVTHIVDHVGSSHYPFPADFIEEAREHGASRRLPPNVDLSRLSVHSRLLLVHSRGLVENAEEVRPGSALVPLGSGGSFDVEGPVHFSRCAHFANTSEALHLSSKSHPCSRDWYTDALPTVAAVPRVDGGVTWFDVEPEAAAERAALADVLRATEGNEAHDVETTRRGVRFYRALPCGADFEVFPREGGPPVRAVSALVASLPLSRVVVVEAADRRHLSRLEALRELAGSGADAVPVEETQA